MITPEKNDVDIEKLFHWGDVFTIILPDGKSFDVYMRVVSDEELNRSRVYALRKASELKEKIYKKGTDEHKAYLPNMNRMKKEEIIDTIIMYELPDLHKKATSEVDIPFPKEPDEDASTIEWVEYQEKVDQYPQLVSEEIRKNLNKIIRGRKKQLNEKHKEVLKGLLENRIIETFVTKELENKFMDSCVYYATYKDKEYRDRLFTSPEQVSKLPSKIREQFVTSYMSIDIPMEELKK